MEKKTAVIFASRPVTARMRQYVPPGALIVAADAGWLQARRLGFAVDLAMGDFDSSPQPTEAKEVVVLPAEKDDTDTHFAAKELLRRGYNHVILLGALGGRLDHEMANYQTMLHLAQNGAAVEAVGEDCHLWCHGGGTLRVPRDDWRWLSVFAAGGAAAGVSLRGLKYPLTDAVLSPDIPLGTSNEFTAETASITCKTGCLYVMVSR